MTSALALLLLGAHALAAPGRIPLSPDELPTTDGKIAAENLDARIDALQKLPNREAALVDALLERAQFFGRIDDLERAARLAERSKDRLVRASVRIALHRFSQAERDLRGLSGMRAESLRSTLLEATGRDDEALAIREQHARAIPSLPTLAAQAGTLAALGRRDEAERIFIAAQQNYRDASPFPLAWIYFQFGLVEERAGHPASARELYQAALARLPIYAAAAGHLAGLTEDRARAIALLQPVVERSDDPEYWGQLAALTGDAALQEKAAARFDELVKKHPEAYRDHAARFWLALDGKKALALAKQNLQTRRTADAHQLVIEAALAAKLPSEACRAVEAATKLPRLSDGLRLASARAKKECQR